MSETTLKEESQEADVGKVISTLDELKAAAKSLEPYIGGKQIEAAHIRSVVDALKASTDVPDQFVSGLTLVVASNAVHNYENPDHRPLTILEALADKSYEKTLKGFVNALEKYLNLSILSRFVCGRHYAHIRIWLIRLLQRKPKQLSALTDVFVQSLLMIANISYHLRSANFSLLHIVRSFGLDAFASAIEKQMETPNTTSDALKLCLLSLLLQDVDRDEERQIKQSQQHQKTLEARARLAPLWLRAFSSTYFTSNAFSGDELFLFANGSRVFGRFTFEQLDAFRATVKKAYLRFPELALPPLSIIFEHTPPTISGEFVLFAGELVQDVLSTSKASSHELAAVIITRALFYYDSTKQAEVLKALFGKNLNPVNHAPYAKKLCLLLNAAAGDLANTKMNVTSLLAALLDVLETELKSAKGDAALSSHAQLFFALSRHMNGELRLRYVSLAFAVLGKQPFSSYPLCSAGAIGGLAILAEPCSEIKQPLAAAAKLLTTEAANFNVSADFTFFTTILLLRYAADNSEVRETHVATVV